LARPVSERRERPSVSRRRAAPPRRAPRDSRADVCAVGADLAKLVEQRGAREARAVERKRRLCFEVFPGARRGGRPGARVVQVVRDGLGAHVDDRHALRELAVAAPEPHEERVRPVVLAADEQPRHDDAVLGREALA